ncbi:hypothetical protein [Burkholderia glumae]|uniref:SMODS-associating 2TM beta-strand rich effector domain-containing protein n=2 Tax=Burkholderia glumae TaxID=337 RepID=A0ABY5BF55_BURGL|nr:hypothetical protein [Burkholderia glumae]USS44472.1 hypothetical protein NFI99_13940 [Burkholderia glumae]UVT00291.1 hypothetical protein EFP20_00540 [Burkholderia glumae]
MMDDLPDKLRRNLVALSAAIVAITMFHLSFKPTGTLLGFAEVGNVTPLKVWTALSAVLVYVFLRYWFHDDTGADRQGLAAHYTQLRYAAIQRYLTRDAKLYFLMRRRQPRWIEGLDAPKDSIFVGIYKAAGRPSTVDLSANVEPFVNSPWSGEVSFSVDVRWRGGQKRGVHNNERHPYRLPRGMAIYISTTIALRTAVYSKSAVDLLVPMVLAAVAAAMCSANVVRAMLA